MWLLNIKSCEKHNTNVFHSLKTLSGQLPANSTFLTMVWIIVDAHEVFTNSTEVCRHLSSTPTTLGTVFTNLKGNDLENHESHRPSQ